MNGRTRDTDASNIQYSKNLAFIDVLINPDQSEEARL